MLDYYMWFKAFHVMSVIAWMAALLYLPRLFVYHADAETGSVQSETFKVMERRLLRGIANPSMIAAWLFGVLMLVAGNGVMYAWTDGWLHVKLTMVVLLTLYHMAMAGWRREFAADTNSRGPRFYRMLNEVPALLMVVIVIMVIVKPF
ncbi:MAG: protoporphyrinogen oxidase HemJ [Pseudomonadota bacterium]|nr:protoporphyrinogen oxidase HemJ [Pseudomonadota bacterium]